MAADGKKEQGNLNMNNNKWFAYVLLCENGALYRGYTNDLQKRFLCHKSGKGAKYTRMNKPVEIVHHEEFETKQEAMKRERYFKSASGRAWLKNLLAGKQGDGQ